MNLNDIFAEDGDVESVKTAWSKVKSTYNVVKNHLGEIAEYDEDILQADSTGKKIDAECKKAINNIEKVKIKYASANNVYRQTIMNNKVLKRILIRNRKQSPSRCSIQKVSTFGEFGYHRVGFPFLPQQNKTTACWRKDSSLCIGKSKSRIYGET